jgi:hypothetical protein
VRFAEIPQGDFFFGGFAEITRGDFFFWMLCGKSAGQKN